MSMKNKPKKLQEYKKKYAEAEKEQLLDCSLLLRRSRDDYVFNDGNM